MKIELLAFGKIAEIVGGKQDWQDAPDTNTLQKALEKKYPDLKELHYRIAVNKSIVDGNTPFPENAVVALMPPFSGG